MKSISNNKQLKEMRDMINNIYKIFKAKEYYLNFFGGVLKRIDILLIFIISFLPLLWFRGNNYIDTADYGFWLSAVKLFNNSFSSFMSDVGSGILSPGVSAFLIPFAIGGVAFKFIGLSIIDYEKFLFVFWFLSSGLSMYYLCSINEVNSYGRFFASLFYMMNPLSLTIYFSTQSGGLISPAYSLAPLILALYIKGINNSKKIIEPILYASFWFLIGDYAYANPVLLINQLLLIFAYFVFYFYFNFKNKQKLYLAIRFTSIFLIFFFILNLYWFIPFFLNLSSMSKFSYLKIQNFGGAYYNYILNSLAILNIERLTGFWAMFGSFSKSLLYYKWSPVYKSGFFIFLSFIPIFFIILGIILFNFYDKNQKKNNIVFFLFIFLFVGLLINAKGSFLGKCLFYITKNLPFFMEAFSTNIIKFGIILSLSGSILFGFGLNRFYSAFKYGGFRFKSIFSLILFIFLFPIYMFPFFNGNIINNGNRHFREGRFRIPSYYYKTKTLLLKNGYGNIFIMPYNLNSSTYLLWLKKDGDVGGYSGGDMIDESIWPYPVYFGYTGGDSINLEELSIYKTFEKSQGFSSISKQTLLIYLGYLGVKYIIFHNDYNWHLKNFLGNYYIFNRYLIKNKLNKIKGIISKKYVEGLYLYVMKKKYIKPLIYDSEYLNLVNNNLNITSNVFNRNISGYLKCNNYLPFLNKLLPIDQSIFIIKSFINRSTYFKIMHSGLTIREFNLNLLHNYCLIFYDKNNSSLNINKNNSMRTFNNIINYKKLSDTQYLIKLKDKNQKSFIVVFGKGFLPYWNAVIISKRVNNSLRFFPLQLREFIYYVFPSFLGKNIAIHFIVNGFANGYLISSKNLKNKNYYVLIEYSLQKYFILGLILDLIIFSFIGLYVIFYFLKKNKGNYNV